MYSEQFKLRLVEFSQDYLRGDKRFKLMVRLDKEWRKSIEQLKSLPIDLPAGNLSCAMCRWERSPN